MATRGPGWPRRPRPAIGDGSKSSRTGFIHLPEARATLHDLHGPINESCPFARLDALKASGERVDRFLEREPLWNSRKPVSLHVAIAAVLGAFMVGWLLPIAGGSQGTTFIAQEEERVFFDIPQTRVMQSYIYVFEPGLTIEADAE